MIITKENYYSRDANKEYMSCSQYKALMKCEAAALAELDGKYVRPSTTALLVGGYVDAYFSGEKDEFAEQHPEIFLKNGIDLKAEYRKANDIIARIERDDMLMRFLGGEKQVIMTGDIGGVPWKIKMDVYCADEAIVDMKIMRDFEPIYVPEKGRVPWYVAWDYILQLSAYQHIVAQNNGGKKLPCYIVAATKQEPCDIDLIKIPQVMLDTELKGIEANVEYIHMVKQGLVEPRRCQKCDYCRETKVITEPSLASYICDDEGVY